MKNIPDSPERGFELALYYAVTKEEAPGKEAVEWAKAHSCEWRQTALIRDWAGNLLSGEDNDTLAKADCSKNRVMSPTFSRDLLFNKVSSGEEAGQLIDNTQKRVLDWLQSSANPENQELYAALEYLSVVQTVEHVDLREKAPQFFNSLPIEFLLSLKPDQVEHPDWMAHIAALALVSLAPNNDSSQFLQGWAIEDRQMIREGPGVGYELLWADPYLPGVGYQNLDPWWYDETRGMLLARSSWEPNACWLQIAPQGVQQINCAADWQTKPGAFGHLQLIPMTQNCVQPVRPAPNSSIILWKLKPNQRVKYAESGKAGTVNAGTSGLLRVPANTEGKICALR